ncbi:MAG: hypothetical protein CSB23_01885 [Deltaproteobacteria bacterium]|nr:MAG: hypothetical protein CSB23_01885 [Deltaproteobacteria bacterium]
MLAGLFFWGYLLSSRKKARFFVPSACQYFFFVKAVHFPPFPGMLDGWSFFCLCNKNYLTPVFS